MPTSTRSRRRDEHTAATDEPMAFGSHRKPEAILLPYEIHERYDALRRPQARLDSALSAARSVKVELAGPFSPMTHLLNTTQNLR